MRHLALIVAATLACGAEPSPAPAAAPADAPVDVAHLDSPGPVGCTPGRVETCPCLGAAGGAQTCLGDGTFGPCMCPDAGADVAPMDVVDVGPEPDVVAPMDARADAPADVDPRQSEVCRGVNATCDGRRVNVQGGERDGGITYHCGGCGITCPAGQGCLTCVCIPL